MSDTHYTAACEVYASCGVNTEAALATLAGTPISLHCWQGDDVGGYVWVDERPEVKARIEERSRTCRRRTASGRS